MTSSLTPRIYLPTIRLSKHDWLLVGGLEHFFIIFYDFPYIGKFVTPTVTHSIIFQRGRSTTKQYFPVIIHIFMVFSTINHPYHPFIDGGRSTTKQVAIVMRMAPSSPVPLAGSRQTLARSIEENSTRPLSKLFAEVRVLEEIPARPLER